MQADTRTIQGPGRMEGEPIWAIHVEAVVMNGFEDGQIYRTFEEIDDKYDVYIDLEPGDFWSFVTPPVNADTLQEDLPTLTEAEEAEMDSFGTIAYWQDSQGFVYVRGFKTFEEMEARAKEYWGE